MLRLIVDLIPINPALGLALEEALLQGVGNGSDDILRIWVNQRSVIIGRSQSVRSEVDLAHLRDLSIPVMRRISGGGAVYHYPGNLNLSLFVRDGHLGTVTETYATIGRAIAGVLSPIGIEATVEGNAILIDKKKIAGAAQVRRGRSLLYHTTLLVTPSAVPIDSVLLAMQGEYESSFVASHPRPVTSLMRVSAGITLESLVRPLSDAIAQVLGQRLQEGGCTKEELEHALRLQNDKYGSDEWNLSR